MAVTGIASAAILIIGIGYGPETSIKVCSCSGGERRSPYLLALLLYYYITLY